MSQTAEFNVLPLYKEDEEYLIKEAARALSIKRDQVAEYRILRRSIDARRKPVTYRFRIEVFTEGEKAPSQALPSYNHVEDKPVVNIIGAGPAGLFAALRCLEIGLKPRILERGKDVRTRRRDLAKIHKEHLVDSDSNYCFGEGGAGTYSDGKLYTRSKKRGDVQRVLEMLVYHGAKDEILFDAHPHIGTNKLPKLIESIRETILEHGGEIKFETRVVDFGVQNGTLRDVVDEKGVKYEAQATILATGHSARDIFHLLKEKEIAIEFKPFALGVRIEHPQALIDRIQYKCPAEENGLPPAAYSIVQQVEGNGVYSFCMCPGGIIAPCATEQHEVVTNGWSPSKRNNPYSNSGMVTTVNLEDIPEFERFEEFAGLEFQRSVEKNCWEAGGKDQTVPAQRMLDFVNGKLSEDLPKCSYQPGIKSVRLDQVLPDFIVFRLKEAFKAFGKKMKGYLTNNAVLVAPESRTSSPVRIPRDKESLQHPEVQGLFPCGEGAGYAGGIVSAAMDGMKTADKCLEHLSAVSQGG